MHRDSGLIYFPVYTNLCLPVVQYGSGHTGFNVDEEKKIYSRQIISKTVGEFLEDLKVGAK